MFIMGYNYYIKWINTQSKNFALISNLKKLISNVFKISNFALISGKYKSSK